MTSNTELSAWPQSQYGESDYVHGDKVKFICTRLFLCLYSLAKNSDKKENAYEAFGVGFHGGFIEKIDFSPYVSS